MAEITIETLVKIIIVVVVIVVVIISVFLIWKNYVQPYLSGIGKEVAGVVLLKIKQKRKF
jgi:uncharacterized protein YpmB